MNGSPRKARTHTVRGKRQTKLFPRPSEPFCRYRLSLSQTRLCIDVTTSAAHWKFDADVKRRLPATECIKMSHTFIEFTVLQTYDTDYCSDSLNPLHIFRSCKFSYVLILSSLPYQFQISELKLYEFLTFFRVHYMPCQYNIPMWWTDRCKSLFCHTVHALPQPCLSLVQIYLTSGD